MTLSVVPTVDVCWSGLILRPFCALDRRMLLGGNRLKLLRTMLMFSMSMRSQVHFGIVLFTDVALDDGEKLLSKHNLKTFI